MSEFRAPGELYRFKPEDGDVFVLKLSRYLRQEDCVKVQEAWKKTVPDHTLIILDPGVTLEMIRK